jgi:hypothetical protein
MVAMACTCWLTDSGAPPSPMKIGVSGVLENRIGETKSERDMIPDFVYTHEAKPIGMVTNIDDKGTTSNADLPYWVSN